jgi:cell wall-associated NlpC family hydrolase
MTEDDLKYHQLTGRAFTGIGNDDCFALSIQFFKDNFGIEITDYPRPNDWESDELNLIELLYEREGFDKITDWKAKDLRPGDVLCMAVGERNPNHLAIFVGNNTIVHHLYGRLSRTDDLRDFWLHQTCFILRHPDVPDLRPVYPDVDIMDLLRARNAPPTP